MSLTREFLTPNLNFFFFAINLCDSYPQILVRFDWYSASKTKMKALRDLQVRRKIRSEHCSSSTSSIFPVDNLTAFVVLRKYEGLVGTISRQIARSVMVAKNDRRRRRITFGIVLLTNAMTDDHLTRIPRSEASSQGSCLKISPPERSAGWIVECTDKMFAASSFLFILLFFLFFYSFHPISKHCVRNRERERERKILFDSLLSSFSLTHTPVSFSLSLFLYVSLYIKRGRWTLSSSSSIRDPWEPIFLVIA